MRVLFVYPNLYTQMGLSHGLASISAVLKQAGHETRLVNLNENLPPVPTSEQVVELAREWGPGVIAFSCLTQQYVAGRELAQELRAALGADCPPLIVGGIHPTMVPEEVMRDGVWDHVGVGECEEAMLEMVERVEAGESPDDVRNFLSWSGGVRPDLGLALDEQWTRNPVRGFPSLANMPAPDYALFDTARILAGKGGWFGIMTSRGCPYRCTYCLNHRLIDRYREDLSQRASQIGFTRYRDPQHVIAEMHDVVARYPGVGTFILDDDLFTQDEAHAIAFCDAYRASGLEIPFVVNAHVKQLSSEVAAALASSGCQILKLGIESGSPRVRAKVLRRPMTDEEMFETIARGEQHGLHTSGFVMVGLPTETRAELWETVDFLARSGLGRFRTSMFYPFPGTEGYDLAWEGGWVREERMVTLTDFTESSCLDFGEEHNLFLEKLSAAMPWFVNSRLEHAPTAARYQPALDWLLGLDRAQWEVERESLRERDAELSAAASAAGELHYAIRYNAAMGVRSDWFQAEEAGLEWSTAAARPVPAQLSRRRLAARALSAAAEERA